MTKKYLGSSKGDAFKMRTSITIIGVFLLAVAALLNIQQSLLAFAAEDEDNNLLHVRKQNTTTDILELVSGIFAAILCVLSIRAYTKFKIKGFSLRKNVQ